MDVSRIEAISPKQIDWRKLTAPEIIEYKEQGVDVPSQYLQWAQGFLADVNAADTDETTYESANSQTQTPTAESAATTTTAEGDEGTEVQEEPKSPAQAKREEMEQNGASFFNIASTFIVDSITSAGDVQSASEQMNVVNNQSENEIQALDDHMRGLLKQAETIQNELKNEVQALNDGENDSSTIGKINKLNAQLQQMGIQAQSNIAGADGKLASQLSFVNAQSVVVSKTEDIGTETVNIGNELLSLAVNGTEQEFMDIHMAIEAMFFGKLALMFAGQASEVKDETINTITDGQLNIQNLSNEVQNKTGIEGVQLNNNAQNQTSEENKNDPANPENQTKDMASADLEQILKAKIRKGENVGNDQLA